MFITKPPTAKQNFYDCASDEDMLNMGFTLSKKDVGELFTRKMQKHWWQTGFVVLMATPPSALTMSCKIDMKDAAMLKAFEQSMIEQGLRRAMAQRMALIPSVACASPLLGARRFRQR